jgi:hypothetical protein
LVESYGVLGGLVGCPWWDRRVVLGGIVGCVLGGIVYFKKIEICVLRKDELRAYD